MSTGVQTAVGRFVWHDHMSGDPDAARSFYGRLLGWETEIWKPGEMDYPMITRHGQMHGGFAEAQGGAPPHWIGHVVVDSADGAAQRAQAAGGSLLGEPMEVPEVGRMVFIQDPQGAAFSAFGPAGQAPASEGVFVWDELLTSDVEGAKAFYGEVVGWTTREMDMGDAGVYTLFSSGEVDRAGAMTPPDPETPAVWLTYLGTEDVDATVANAEDLGGSKHMGPTDVPTVGRIAVLSDPTEAFFGLFGPVEAAA